jgi:hypothetical protein
VTRCASTAVYLCCSICNIIACLTQVGEIDFLADIISEISQLIWCSVCACESLFLSCHCRMQAPTKRMFAHGLGSRRHSASGFSACTPLICPLPHSSVAQLADQALGGFRQTLGLMVMCRQHCWPHLLRRHADAAQGAAGPA